MSALQNFKRSSSCFFQLLSCFDGVVVIMRWRIQTTVQSRIQADFVYGLGNVGLVTHFSRSGSGLPWLAYPHLHLFSRNISSHLCQGFRGAQASEPARDSLRKPQYSIGSSESRGFRKKNFSHLGRNSLIELEEGRNFSKAEAMLRSHSNTRKDNEPWISDPNAIGGRHDVRVYAEPQE